MAKELLEEITSIDIELRDSIGNFERYQKNDYLTKAALSGDLGDAIAFGRALGRFEADKTENDNYEPFTQELSWSTKMTQLFFYLRNAYYYEYIGLKCFEDKCYDWLEEIQETIDSGELAQCNVCKSVHPWRKMFKNTQGNNICAECIKNPFKEVK